MCTIDQLTYINHILDKCNLTKYSNPSPIPMGATKLQKNKDQASSKDIAQFQIGMDKAI